MGNRKLKLKLFFAMSSFQLYLLKATGGFFGFRVDSEEKEIVQKAFKQGVSSEDARKMVIDHREKKKKARPKLGK